MSEVCSEPIMTGETAGVKSWEPCGRALHGSTGLCVDHARDAGLIARSFLSPEAREKMAAGRRGSRKPTGDPAVAAEKKALASKTAAEIRSLRKEASDRRRVREAAADRRVSKSRGPRLDD